MKSVIQQQFKAASILIGMVIQMHVHNVVRAYYARFKLINYNDCMHTCMHEQR